MKKASPQRSQVRAAICARVSTTDQARGSSINTQIERGEHYAASRSWNLVGIYVDGGVSGKYASRPDLDRLMADCRAGLIDAVIVEKIDRFGRSLRHGVALIGELEDLGVEFVSITERLDNTPEGRLQRNFFMSIAEWERERIRARTTDGMSATARAGWWPAGPAPFGWKVVPAKDGKHKTTEINPKEAAVWERIAECLIDRRMSGLATARELNAAGMRTRHGKLWRADSVWKLVRDTKCLSGTWVYRRTDHRQRREVLGPPIEIAVDPIFTPERHEELKGVIKERSWSRKQIREPWLLSQRITSPCGQMMWAFTNHYGNRRYRCASKALPRVTQDREDCGCYQVHANDLEVSVWSAVSDALSNPDLLLAFATDQAAVAAAAQDVSQSDLAALDHKIARLEKAAGASLAAALAAGLDPKIAVAAGNDLAQQLEEARDQRAKLAAWAADAADRRSRGDLISKIAAESAEAIAKGDDVAARQQVLAALDIQVRVTGWTACEVCGGSGKHTGGRVGANCTECHGMRRKAEIDVSGTIPVAGDRRQAESWPVRLVG